MFHSCSISVFINLLIGLDIIPTVRIGGSEPKMGERPRAPTQPLLSFSFPLPSSFVLFLEFLLIWSRGWRWQQTQGGGNCSCSSRDHVMLPLGRQTVTPAKAVCGSCIAQKSWHHSSAALAHDHRWAESNAIFLLSDGTADWRVKRQISQIRVASWLLNPWSRSPLSSLGLLPYGRCLKNVSPHSPSPSAILLIHSIHLGHSCIKMWVKIWSLYFVAADLQKGGIRPCLWPDEEGQPGERNRRLAEPCSALPLPFSWALS